VTELVTGLDLVQLQLRIASGEPLPFTQDDVTCSGHAFEARVYAEDAFGGFLPQAGVAESVRWSPRARVDAALESGQVVSTSYDPMLGKVIVHGPDRETARRALVDALDDTAIVGLTTNLGFLRALAASPEFRDNQVHTAWLDTHPDALRPDGREVAAVVAAWALATRQGQDGTPFGTGDGWRLAGPSARTTVELVVDGVEVVFRVGRHEVTTTYEGEERAWAVHPIAAEADVLRLEIDDRIHEATVRIGPHRVDVAHLGHTFGFDRPDAFGPGAHAASSDGSVVAPMPGTVLSVVVEEGASVEAGAVLGVMEAMKMELSLKAPLAGTVTAVRAAEGDQVALGATLFTVEAGA
jgi:3-methylcrotonyl-CoA carboxylase alpha subunit/acetyl-CoA/propionyl-CoA carboxylase biotin carboxyl carrier protein